MTAVRGQMFSVLRYTDTETTAAGWVRFHSNLAYPLECQAYPKFHSKQTLNMKAYVNIVLRQLEVAFAAVLIIYTSCSLFVL